MGGLSIWHWLIILAVFILLFGAKKLPDAARGLGRSLRILKSEVGAMSDDKKEAEAAAGNTAAPATATSASVVEPIEAPAPIQPSSVSGQATEQR